MGWGALEEVAKGGNGGKYFKLRDGDRFEVITLGEPYTMQKTWAGGRTSTRFCTGVYCLTAPAGAQQYEFGPGVARDMAVENAKPGETVVRLKRKGSGKNDTEYTIAEVRAATPEEIKAAHDAYDERDWNLEDEGWVPVDGEQSETTPADDVPF